MKLPWRCEDCNHKEVAGPFETFIECPNCESPNFFHGQMIDDEEEK